MLTAFKYKDTKMKASSNVTWQIVMNPTNDNSILAPALTAEESVERAEKNLISAMTEFDTWIKMNPNLASQVNPEYKLRYQNIKVLRIKVHEAKDIRDHYQNMLRTLT